MNLLTKAVGGILLLLPGCAPRAEGPKSAPTLEEVRAVSPALGRYTETTVLGDLWKRPGLSPRDRSLVTLAALIARDQTVELPHHVSRALDFGVKPAELSEVVTHLAFYTGWGNATSAVAAIKEVFDRRGVKPGDLPPAEGPLLPINREAEAQRAARVEQNFGALAPGVVKYTSDLLFNDLWLRPALAPRDRSLVTVAAFIATGQVAQLPYHLDRALDNGLTKGQLSEALTQLAFYAGWPDVFTALPVVKEVVEKRKEPPPP